MLFLSRPRPSLRGALAGLLLALGLVALPACGLFGSEDGGPPVFSNLCENADREGEVVRTSFASCQASGGEWLEDGDCYCPYRGGE